MEYAAPKPFAEGMKLVWHDEFDGDKIDMAKWAFKAKMAQSDIINGTGERNARIDGGELLLQCHREEGEKPFSTNCSLTTDGTMSYRYGYLEMCANPPFFKGAWPSFWMQSDRRYLTTEYFVEVDIFEIFASKDQVYPNLHKWWKGGHVQLPGGDRGYTFPNPETLNDEYHLYGFGWTPERMYFTVDGEEYYSYNIGEEGDFGGIGGMAGFQDPLYIILNNFLFTEGSRWKPGDCLVDENTTFPVEYRVKWMRLWQDETGELFIG